jgi:hypothetical protein
MAWDDETFDAAASAGGHNEPIEMVGTNLRVIGTVSLGRFGRLTDLINASSGYLRIRDARLLQRNGDPTDLNLPELMVDQDEISFIAQTSVAAPEPGAATGFIEPVNDTTVEHRKARAFVIFTPGHTVSGKVYIFGQTDLAAFVDSTDPRFVPVVDVTTRSLADRQIVSHYDFVLVNRTQMIAAAETGRQGDIAVEDLPEL